MITIKEARNKVKGFLKIDISKKCEVYLFDEYTIETKICWVFFYGNSDIQIAGNAPIIIDKEHEIIYGTGTGTDVEIYLKAFKNAYKKFGNDPEILESALQYPEMYT